MATNLYGNRTIIPNNYYFTFDKIYPKVSEILAENFTDSVMIGRAVLAQDTHEVYIKTTNGYQKVAKLDNTGRFDYLEGYEISGQNIDSLSSNGNTYNDDGVYIVSRSKNTLGTWPNPKTSLSQSTYLNARTFLLRQYSEDPVNGKVNVYQELIDITNNKYNEDSSRSNLQYNNKTFVRRGVFTYIENSGNDQPFYFDKNRGRFIRNTGKGNPSYTRSETWQSWIDLSEQYIGYIGNLGSGNADTNLGTVVTIVSALNELDKIIGHLKKLQTTNSLNTSTTLVEAINKLNEFIGNLSNLSSTFNYTNKGNIVECLTSLDGLLGNLKTAMGNNATLTAFLQALKAEQERLDREVKRIDKEVDDKLDILQEIINKINALNVIVARLSIQEENNFKLMWGSF